MAGYSGTPLVRKLGLKEGARFLVLNAPPNFMRELGQLPTGATLLTRRASGLKLILLFVRSQTELSQNFARLSTRLEPDGALWVAWPKRSSGDWSDLSFALVQRLGLVAGLVDTKVCAIDNVWSALKFVFRIKDRAGRKIDG